MDFDFRRFEHAKHGVVVEIVLLHTAVFERDFGFEGSSEAEDDTALHLGFDDVGIDDTAAIDRADDAMDADRAVFLD